jgi:tetratricopeptide (TPR) repeat protein
VTRPGNLPGNLTRPGIGQDLPTGLPGTSNRPGGIGIGGPRPGGDRPGVGTLPGNINRPGITTRPGDVTRPGIGGNRPGDRPGITTLPGDLTRPGNRPGIGGNRPGDRPGITTLPGDLTRPGNRPGIGGNRPGDRPGIGDRPGWGNRPGWDRPTTRPWDRPDWNNGPGWGNRPGIGDNNNIGNVWNNNNNNWNINNNYWNNNVNVNRPWGPGWGGGFPPYYGGWYGGSWRWNGPTWWSNTGAFTAGWMLGASTSFVNPYYVAPVVGSSVVFNYSEPVPVFVDSGPVVVQSPPTTVIVQQDAPVASPVIPSEPTPTEPSQEQEPQVDPKVKEAGVKFDVARDAFKNQKLDEALAAVDQAIKILPTDAALHEFRALVLFAQKRYQEAAAVLYSVLVVGPGWNWDTVKALYSDPSIYEKQLNALMEYVKQNEKDAASRFVLAYHALVLDELDTAVKLLRKVVELNPKDELAAAMAKAIGESLTPRDERPKVGS